MWEYEQSWCPMIPNNTSKCEIDILFTFYGFRILIFKGKVEKNVKFRKIRVHRH